MAKKLPTGYDKKKNKKPKAKKRNYIASLIIPHNRKVGIAERIIKILIYLALRIVIKPSKWKEPEKNYELIDRVYRRLMSADFVYIPSSIAFYIVMAFMPLLAMIMLVSSIEQLDGIFGIEDVKSILGKFIPGINFIMNELADAIKNNEITTSSHIAGISGTITLYFISTWIAAGGMSKLVFTQSYIYGHKYVGGWWMNRFRGVGMVIGMGAFLIITLMINIQVNSLINMFDISTSTKEVLRYLFLIFGLLLLLFILFIGLFKFSPRFKIKIKEVIPGAMVAALPSAIFLSLFSVFASTLSFKIYGLISALMYVGLISIWISTFLFVGLITNEAYFRTHVSDKPRFKWTISKK